MENKPGGTSGGVACAGCAAAIAPSPPLRAGPVVNKPGVLAPLGLGAITLPGSGTALDGGTASVMPPLMGDWFGASRAAPLAPRCHCRAPVGAFGDAMVGRS